MVLVDIAKERPQPLVALSPGAQTPLQATKTTLTAFRGADGPLIVITPPEGRPFLAAPRRSATDKVARVEGKSLGFVPGWRVTFEATRRAGTYLMLSALVLFLLGFGLCLLIPDVTVSLRSVEAGKRCQVEITSLNRSRSLNSIFEGICGQQEGI